jgi:predicted permease
MAFFTIFLNVMMPVFGIVVIGYFLGNRLNLQAGTLTKTAYYILVPCFIYEAISNAEIAVQDALKLFCFVVISQLIIALIAGAYARLLGRSREMIAAFVIVAIAGNVGNYGIAVIIFRLGEAATASATIFYVIMSITIFIGSVGIAGWARGGSSGMLRGLVKTPAIWAAVLGLLAAGNDLVLPTMTARLIGLLAQAMIPIMLLSLGLQLLEQKQLRFSADLLSASCFRLLVAPLIAAAIAVPFGLGEIDHASGVLQFGMPTAVVATIIAKEHDIDPTFIISAVVFTVLASLITLPRIMLAV